MIKPPADLSAPLLDTLELVSRLTASAQHHWWIIGGAGMRLHGASGIEPTDIDIQLHPDDAEKILANAGIGKTSDGGNGRFRSQVYGTITTARFPSISWAASKSKAVPAGKS